MNTSLGAISEMLYCNSRSSCGGFPDVAVKARADMKWFRSNIRLGSRLALLALAIQFLLSFGHFHGGDASVASADTTGQGLHDGIAFATDASDQAVSPAKVSGPKVFVAKIVRPVRLKTSSDHAPLGHAGDDCAICAVMALANTMLDAAPPLLPSPHATAFSYGPIAARYAEPDPVRVAFQPRAPPIA
jgi:hypothetical protein